MTNTDPVEWKLFDTDLTTGLDILPANSSHLYLELNEPGSGEVKIPLDSNAADDIASGQFAEMSYRGDIRGGFFVENFKNTHADRNNERWMLLSGRGALALLDDAIVWDTVGETKRVFDTVSAAEVIITLIDEAQARGGLGVLSYDFSTTLDSSAVSWTDSGSYEFPVGKSLLEVVRSLAGLGIDFDITPDGLGNFVLSAYKNGVGTDKHTTIYFRIGTNCTEVGDEEIGGKIRNVMRVKYNTGYSTVQDDTSITNRRRREKLLQAEYAKDPALARLFAQAELANTKDPQAARTIRVTDGVSPRLFEDYILGDTITLDKLGVEASYRIRGIEADFEDGQWANVVLNLNSMAMENSINMARDITWLKDLWATAHDADLLDATFWAAISSDCNDTVRAFYLDGTTLYVGGDFTRIGGIDANHLAMYDILTGAWSEMGTGLAGTYGAGSTSCYAINKVSSSIIVTGNFSSANGVSASCIASWNGTTFAALTTGLNASGNTLAVTGTDLYVGGLFTLAGGIANTKGVAKWSGGAWTALGNGANIPVLAIAFIGSTLYVTGNFNTVHGGAVSASGIAKWSGSTWSALGTGLSAGNKVGYALVVLGTDLYVAGDFTAAGGISGTAYIAKYDGSWHALGTGLDDRASSLATDGLSIFVSGEFINAGDVEANGIARWDGGAFNALGEEGLGPQPGTYPFSALACYQTTVFVGGDFLTAGGKDTPYIAMYLTTFTDIADYLESSGFDLAKAIHNATAKSPPAVAADEFGIWDSVTHLLRKFTWANLVASIYGTANRVFLTSTLGYLTTDSKLNFDHTEHQLVIGDTSAAPISGGRGMHEVGDGQSVGNLMYSYSDTTTIAPFIAGLHIGGTLAAKTKTLVNSILFRLRGRGYYSTYSNTQAEIDLLADEDFNDATHLGTRIEFKTTPKASGTLTLAATIENDGSLTNDARPMNNYVNTQANIEALTSVPEGAQAYATDIDMLGTFDGAAWNWIDPSGGGGSIPVVTSDPGSPADGELWLLRETTTPHADGEIMGALAMTYTSDTPVTAPLVLSVWDDDQGLTGRQEFTWE